LKDYRLLCETPKGGAARVGGVGVWNGLALDARPGKVDVEEQEEDAEADDGGLLSLEAHTSG
jgi:hypothetical protein